MKRFSFLLVLLLTASLICQAQNSIIPRIGVIVSTVTGDDEEGADSKAGLLIGADLDLAVTDNLFISPGLLFVQKGWSAETPGDDITIGLNYLEIPVLIKYNFGGDALSFYAEAGPAMGIGIGVSEDADDLRFEFGEDDNLNAVDIGLQLGGGLNFGVGSRQLNVDIRYNIGLTEIIEDVEVYNRAAYISLGYRIPFGQ